jgi:tRNA(Ile2) C34 agmatinyltransferase TiaS
MQSSADDQCCAECHDDTKLKGEWVRCRKCKKWLHEINPLRVGRRKKEQNLEDNENSDKIRVSID